MKPEEAFVSDAPLKITVTETGPYKVEPGTELCDAAGNPIETREGKAYFLCRCGMSANKPFCDGTHNREEWDPTLASSG